MEANIWERIKIFLRISAKEQKAETAAGGLLGLAAGWHWVFAFVPAWMGNFLTPALPVIKGMVVTGASALVSNLISYFFKKYAKVFLDKHIQKKSLRATGRKKRA